MNSLKFNFVTWVADLNFSHELVDNFFHILCFVVCALFVLFHGVLFFNASQGVEESYLTVMLAKFIAQIDLVLNSKR